MPWRIDFPMILTLLTALTGLIYLLDVCRWSKQRSSQSATPVVVEWCRSFFPILFIVWGVRSFVVQPYRVPSGSLEPTILQGDFLLATQYNYGVFFPAGHWRMLKTGEPKIGDIALFYPPKKSGHQEIFVKRVVGLPGDHVVYRNHQLTVNGQVARQKVIGPAINYIWYDGRWVELPAQKREENLFGMKHQILVTTHNDPAQPVVDVVVPKDSYFMMGDNRDFSDDSRYWGTVPAKNLVGKAWRLVMSWNPFNADKGWYRLDQRIRWQRIGTKL